MFGRGEIVTRLHNIHTVSLNKYIKIFIGAHILVYVRSCVWWGEKTKDVMYTCYFCFNIYVSYFIMSYDNNYNEKQGKKCIIFIITNSLSSFLFVRMMNVFAVYI